MAKSSLKMKFIHVLFISLLVAVMAATTMARESRHYCMIFSRFCPRRHAFLSPIFEPSPTVRGSSRLGLQGSDEVEDLPPIFYDPSQIRYRCRVAYDGTSFSGFQLQGGRAQPSSTQYRDFKTDEVLSKLSYKNKHRREQHNTIQGELEKALSRRFDRVVKVVGAGRTDAGVHGRGQAIHFDLYHNETKARETKENTGTIELELERSMNSMLVGGLVVVWNLQRAPPPITKTVKGKKGIFAWNSMKDCTGKLYCYRICIGNSMDPIERFNRWHVDRGHQVDPNRLERILSLYEGKHDFVCFSGVLEQQERKTGIARDTVRTIQSIRLVQEKREDGDETYFRIDIYLDGALYKMVRNMVGTALDVCRGWNEEQHFRDMLQRPAELNYTRKDNLSKPAPPQGLTLETVFYEDNYEF